MTRILITGSRHWDNRETIQHVLAEAREDFGDATLVHGDCPYGGADLLAAEAWEALGLPVEAHPADWMKHGRAAGPKRNQEMVAAGADVCLAFPSADSRGTWDCVRRAEKAGIPVRIFSSDTGA